MFLLINIYFFYFFLVFCYYLLLLLLFYSLKAHLFMEIVEMSACFGLKFEGGTPLRRVI